MLKNLKKVFSAVLCVFLTVTGVSVSSAYPLGVYVGNNPSNVTAHETWLGKNVDTVLVFVGQQDWADFKGSAGWLKSIYKDIDRPLVWSIPLIPGDGVSTLDKAANGEYNEHYLHVANVIAAYRPQDPVIYVRPGWEFNTDGHPWKAAGKTEQYKGSFRQLVNTFKSVSDRFRFVWCTNFGYGTVDPESCYPGDAYVDVIGMDLYDETKYSHIDDPVERWNYYLNEPRGLNWLKNFAASHGKLLSVDEWATGGNQSGDNPYFIVQMKNFLEENDVVFTHYWDSNAHYEGMLRDDTPLNAAAMYKWEFSGAKHTLPGPDPKWNIIRADLSNYTSGWELVKSDGTVIQNDGYVTIIDNRTDKYTFLRKTDIAPEGPFTFEVRAKVNEPGTTNEFTVRSGSYQVSLYLTYGVNGTAQNMESNPTKTYTVDTTIYHDYRVVVHSDYSYDLYVDGVLAWQNAPSLGSGTNLFRMGGSNPSKANMDVDNVLMGNGELLPEWDIIYDNLDKYNAGWEAVYSGGSIIQNNGYVTIEDYSDSTYTLLRKTNVAPSGPFTFEVKAKVNAPGTKNEITIQNGAYKISLYLTYGIFGTAQNMETNPTKSVTLDTHVYHIYRVVVHPDYTYDLYVDGQLAWSGSPNLGSGTNLFRIGGSVPNKASMDVDYVRLATGELIP